MGEHRPSTSVRSVSTRRDFDQGNTTQPEGAWSSKFFATPGHDKAEDTLACLSTSGRSESSAHSPVIGDSQTASKSLASASSSAARSRFLPLPRRRFLGYA